jgi:hypothetical protein
MNHSERSHSPWHFLSALGIDSERDRQLLQLTRAEELTVASHLVAGSTVSILYARSGNGKSSLINAGLIPFFLEKGYAVFRTRPRPPYSQDDPTIAFQESVLREQWLPASPVPAGALLESAMQELASQPFISNEHLGLRSQPFPITLPLLQQLQAQAGRLSSSPEARAADLRFALRPKVGPDLKGFVGVIQELLGCETRILFICDQFEELFNFYYDTAAFRNFIAQIASVCDDKGLKCQFLFSMREDAVGSMIELRTRIPDIFANVLRLAPLRMSKARFALTFPASEADITIEEALVDRILSDLAAAYSWARERQTTRTRLQESPGDDKFVELPALQIVADSLWNTREKVKEPFTLSHYETLAKPSHGEIAG